MRPVSGVRVGCRIASLTSGQNARNGGRSEVSQPLTEVALLTSGMHDAGEEATR